VTAFVLEGAQDIILVTGCVWNALPDATLLSLPIVYYAVRTHPSLPHGTTKQAIATPNFPPIVFATEWGHSAGQTQVHEAGLGQS